MCSHPARPGKPKVPASSKASGESLDDQYRDSSNLGVRAQLQARYCTNAYGWTRWVFDQLDLTDGCRLLEVGCGTGWLWRGSLHRIPSGCEITLTDTSPGMVAEARESLAGARHAFAFQVADAQVLPFAGRAFDGVMANHMLYHVPDLDEALAELRRVLCPGGRLYATTIGADHMKELAELVGALAPELPLAKRENARRFGLENGEAKLGAFFDNVIRRPYEDALEVPETEPLVAYVLSVRGAKQAFTPDKMAELRRRIEERIATHGTFHITKAVGMFTAACPS